MPDDDKIMLLHYIGHVLESSIFGLRWRAGQGALWRDRGAV